MLYVPVSSLFVLGFIWMFPLKIPLVLLLEYCFHIYFRLLKMLSVEMRLKMKLSH